MDNLLSIDYPSIGISAALLGVLAVAVLGSVLYDRYLAKKDVPLGGRRLPGPKGIPILGVVHQMPQKHPWLKFFEWSKQYGELYSCNLAGENICVISSTKIASDVLVKRKENFSSRPKMPAIMPDPNTSMHYIALMREGVDHKRGRKYVKHMITNTPREQLVSFTQKAAAALALKLISNSSNWQHDTEVHIGHISAQVAWGDKGFPAAEFSAGNANILIPKISPDGAIVNKLPFLAKLPNWVPLFLQPWKKAELARSDCERNFWLNQMARVRCGELKGDSWASKWLFDSERRMLGISDEIEATYAHGFLAMIGSVLLSSPLQVLFLTLIHHPEWQKKAQDQIAAVCGDRCPTDGDMQDLPVVRALLREAMRWRPSVPLGVPHVAEEDHVYDGYYIPKETVCMASEWSLTRDETLYPDPESFRPERWLDPKFPTFKEPLTHHPELKNTSSFGWGARACPGAHYSEIVLFSMASTLLWACTITKSKDPWTGVDLEVPLMDFGPPNAIVKPTWFPMNVAARSEEKTVWLRGNEG